jgi:DNA-binding MarR family transcriptional regulator
MQERFEQFTVLIAKTSRLIRKIKTEEVAELGLKGMHVSCLYYLYKAKKLTAKELCEFCDEDKGAISRSLDYLEKNGYVYCADTAKKRYKSPIELTEKGLETSMRLSEKIDRALSLGGEGLTEEKRQIFYESLALVCENLERVCKSYQEEEND